MKKILLLFSLVIIITSCTSDNDKPDTNNDGTLSFSSYFIDKLSTGEDRQTEQTLAIVHIWNADDTDFDFDKSSGDLLTGYVFDKNQNKSLKANYSYIDKWMFSQELKPGKYVIYVNYGEKVPYAKFSYSYTYFEIKEKEVTFLKKHLRNANGLTYHPWE